MIVELELHTKLGYEGSIKWKYIDNNFTKKHQLALLDATNKQDSFSGHWFPLPLPAKDWNQEKIDELIKYMKDTIHELSRINNERDYSKGQQRIGYPIKKSDIKFIKGKDLENQALLNRIHRYFTTLHQSLGKIDNNHNAWGSYYYTRYDMSQLAKDGIHDNKIFSFKATPEMIRQIRDLSEETNKTVHKLEVYCNTPHKNKMKEINYQEFNVEFLPQRWRELHPVDRKYLTYKPGATVWFTQNQVLGKNYAVAYTDHDNPNEHDIWEGVHFTGSFTLGDRSYSHWEPYTTWMNDAGLESIPYGIPLGYIIEGLDKVPTLTPHAIKRIKIHQD